MAKIKRKKRENTKNKGMLNLLKNKFGLTPLYLMFLILLSAVALVIIISNVDNDSTKSIVKNFPILNNNHNTELKKFASAEEFEDYLQSSEDISGSYNMMGIRNIAMPMMEEFAMDSAVKTDSAIGTGGASSMPNRISETNVQVSGIDEPDILKTDGKEIYFSNADTYYWRMMPEAILDVESDAILPRPDVYYTTKLFNAWPPNDLKLDSEINLLGNLLLSDNNLMILSGQRVDTFDVSNKENPEQKWELKLDSRSSIVTSRLYNNKLYLIVQNPLNRYNPCPIMPLSIGGSDLKIACTDIYHPINPSPVDATFVAMVINPENGQVENKVSFLGSTYSSTVYMSQKNLYVTYNDQIDMFEFMLEFLNTEVKDLLPQSVLAKLNKINTYDISSNSKMTEMQILLEEWLSSTNDDQLLKLESELENRADKYFEEHKRQMYGTGIVKIGLNKLAIEANGRVPGTLLNQFSLDEYDDHLRVATTVGNRWGFGMSGAVEEANDVYVLDKNLKTVGSVTDLGLSERIYSARFVGPNGYLVTFRQTDPFYVIDLSDHKNPKMVGELKIPGYSSYLHPISDTKILGIGMEGGQVKISYFDVSNPTEPKEIDKYSLSDYGSDALYNHHAFLLDSKHQVFFLPSYKGGYVFSYANDKLELVRAVSVNNVKRALYLEDYMYIVADEYMAILDENNWEKVNEIDF
ncbi:beta-propeller domain-containing protein [Patescibacteria group bacterium]|nr:beta-propeller domain-containing protein [Patescibacteria group bacterium]